MFSREMLQELGVKKVIFNDKATIVITESGGKGVAVCGKKDVFEAEEGFCRAYLRALSDEIGVDNKALTNNISFIEKRKSFEV